MIGASLFTMTSFITAQEIIYQYLYKVAFRSQRTQVKQDYLDYFKQIDKEQLSMINKDGIKLNGYYIHNDNARFMAILIHGHQSCAFRMKRYVEALINHFQCHIFIPDLRGHGDSEGEIVGFGYLDADDIEEWIQILAKKSSLPIVVLGVSMGGATVCQLSSKDIRQVACLIEDCSFDTLYNQIAHVMKHEYHLKLKPMKKMISRILKRKSGYTLDDVQPIQHVKKATKPMLFIHGQEDDYIPIEMMHRLYEACTSEKRKVEIAHANHAESIKVDPDTYIQEVKSFIEQYIS